MKEIKKCSVCGSTNKVCNTEIGLLCGKHYSQFKRHGKILERTKYDPNEIKVLDEYAVIVLYDKNANPIAEALIDKTDIELVKNSKWCVDKNNYVKNSKQGYLHRVILNEQDLYVDHINGNTLDNRFSNLRLIDNGLNRRNSKSKNQYRGVSYHSRDNVYELNFQYRNKNYYIGRDDNPYVLAQLYDYLCHLIMDKGQFNFEVLDDLSELLDKSKPNTIKKFNYVKQLILENENK